MLPVNIVIDSPTMGCLTSPHYKPCTVGYSKVQWSVVQCSVHSSGQCSAVKFSAVQLWMNNGFVRTMWSNKIIKKSACKNRREKCNIKPLELVDTIEGGSVLLFGLLLRSFKITILEPTLISFRISHHIKGNWKVYHVYVSKFFFQRLFRHLSVQMHYMWLSTRSSESDGRCNVTDCLNLWLL